MASKVVTMLSLLSGTLDENVLFEIAEDNSDAILETVQRIEEKLDIVDEKVDNLLLSHIGSAKIALHSAFARDIVFSERVKSIDRAVGSLEYACAGLVNLPLLQDYLAEAHLVLACCWAIKASPSLACDNVIKAHATANNAIVFLQNERRAMEHPGIVATAKANAGIVEAGVGVALVFGGFLGLGPAAIAAGAAMTTHGFSEYNKTVPDSKKISVIEARIASMQELLSDVQGYLKNS
ncbi:MAG: hypothetical protein EAY65_03060 [Alphaproteobacteria bacterium]|nr:MAG: hypothetical protein EAY65_03060 [Alphaproteobacteria bacterium]